MDSDNIPTRPFEGISLYCPIQTVSIFAGSDRLDDIGQFTKFVLWAIGNGYTSFAISEAIELSKYIIDDEISYLIQIGFVVQEDMQLSISETGKGYLELISAVDDFNRREHTARLNWFSGEVLDSVSPVFDNVPPGSVSCDERVSKFLILNKNYAPLRTYVDSRYSDMFSNLSNEFVDSLYFYLQPKIHNERCYQEYRLTSIPSIGESYPYTGESMVCLSRPVKTLQFRYEDERLMMHRNVLETLRTLDIFDSELLSEKAKQILAWYIEEQKINESVQPLYIDTSTGEELIVLPQPNQVNPNVKRIDLPARECAYESEIYIGNTFYKRTPIREHTSRYEQPVPFALFREVIQSGES